MERPFVCINMAVTADGKITSAAREYPRFASSIDRSRMDRLRAESDGILVGAGTMRADNPPLHIRDENARRHRKSLGKSGGLLRVLVTASGEIAGNSRFFEDPDGGERVIATVEDAPDDALSAVGDRAEIWRLGRGSVDLPAVLARLRGRGVERLLVEGGGELNWAFVKEGLVDEIYLTVTPILLGGRDAPTLLEGDGLRMAEQVRLKLLSVDREGDELFCRYAVVR
jgi:2,5-diamino-6-(ribosylamino)-4(3H)-pyrimidinone 5'-phosphate reductase